MTAPARARRTALRALFVAAALVGVAPAALADDLTVLCAGAMRPAIAALLDRRDPSRPHVVVRYATAGDIRARFDRGERPDVLIAPADLTADLIGQQTIDAASRRPLGETDVGIAVRAAAPRPDVGTPDALRATLLAAERVVIVDPTKGTSGRLIEALFRSMGIEDRMRPKLLKIDGGMVTEAVARGEADLGFQQVSEILPVAGVELVGTLPEALRQRTRYDLSIVAGSPHRADADALARELTSPEAAETIGRAGFTAVRRQPL